MRLLKNLLADARWAESRREPAGFLIGLTTFGILALELALIRWTSSQMRTFAYFNNIVLICSFLGIGLGVGLGKRHAGLVHLTLPFLAVLALPLGCSVELGLVQMTFPDQSVMLWGAEADGHLRLFAWRMGIFLALLALVVGVFVCAGAGLGRLFGGLPALRAYHADLVGSLLGVLGFTVVAWMNAGPIVWFALGCLPFVWLSRRWLSCMAATLTLVLAHWSTQGAVFSPYNRIDLVPDAAGNTELNVNRDFHQYMFDLSDGRLADPSYLRKVRLPPRELRALYDLPFTLNPHRRSALIVGAGTGNDVQAALRNGYRQITSVDIDGRIIQLGRELHPEKPYANAAVRVVVDDARAYFEKREGEKYDVVCYGLLDSHAMVSAMSTLRLDNYVYTEEGIRAAWNRVAPGGHLSLAMSCFAGPWFFERMYWTVARATGWEPIAFFSDLHLGTATFVVMHGGVEPPATALAGRKRHVPARSLAATLTTSDDWPFLYLRPGVVPWGYLVVLGTLLGAAAVAVRRVYAAGQTTLGLDWPLFLMGAAFLLIETRGVTSLSLLFGSTWVVNSAVFAGILSMALVSNAAVRRWRWTDPRPWFLALFAAVALLCFFPLHILHFLPLLGRGIAGGLLTGLPIGLAGIVVPMLLARSPHPTEALGSNLLGAVVGGCLEYYSMFGGLRATALMALALYLVAFLLVQRSRVRSNSSGK